MHFTELSGLMAVLWSSFFILLIYYIRKKGKVNRLSEILCLVFLYLFSVVRMLVPIDFIPSIGINLPGLPSDIYEKICVIKRGTGIFSITISQIFCTVWAVVAIINLFLYFNKYRKVVRWVRIFRRYEGIDSVMDRVEQTLGKKINVEVRRGIGVDSPVGIGIFHKMVVLPDQEMDAQDLYHILLHECTHFYNYDMVVKMLIQIYILCFWWNPLVLILKKDLELSLEIKCDLRAVEHMTKDEVISYLETIMKVVKGTDDTIPVGYTGIVSLTGKEETELTERFWIMVDNQRKNKNKAKTASYVVVFVLLFILSYSFMPKPYFNVLDEEIEVQDNMMKFDSGDTYLLKQKDGKYRLIKENEIDKLVSKKELKFLISQGFEVKEEER